MQSTIMTLGWSLLVVFCVSIFNKNVDAQLNFDLRNGTYEKELKIEVNSTNEVILLFPSVNTKNPFRIHTYAPRATKNTPILVMVRQEKQVASWQLPALLETTTRDDEIAFKNVSKTMCHDRMENIINPRISNRMVVANQSFIVALSTSNFVNSTVYVKVSEEKDFYVELNKDYHLTVSPTEPKYVYFSFTTNVSDTIIIEVDSEDDVCFTTSVQNSSCPVLDSNKEVTYEGYYQTVSRKGALTIHQRNFNFGFFLVFVVKPDNYDCGQIKSVLPLQPKIYRMSYGNRTSEITFNIKNSINYKDYFNASIVTFFVYVGFGLIILLMTLAFNKWGTLSTMTETKFDQVDGESIDQLNPQSQETINYLLKHNKITLNVLAQFPIKDKRRSFNYLWHICSIAIFYSIPVVQLVVTYQRVVNRTGNQDMCYYNFLCAHPKFGFSDFNHIYSNIGYVLIGIMFLFATLHRHVKVPLRFETGIPVHYGLFYSMGVALIIEGLLSASYHICPSQSNYQFDTSFMYVMAVLCMVKLYQNRHPDINASAYATFSVLGIAIFLAMIGILNGSLSVWIMFAVAYSLLCVYISFKIYYLSFIFDGFKKLKEDIMNNGLTAETFAPVKKVRFVLLTLVNLLNYGILIAGILMWGRGLTDFGTFLLGLLMGNSIIHAIFYTSMKLVNRERICFEACIYGVLAVASWAAATVFFLDAATLWTVTAAESREWNQGCILMNFYDKHDVWHLLSAPALFFTFMYLLCLDDDLINTKHSDIEVF